MLLAFFRRNLNPEVAPRRGVVCLESDDDDNDDAVPACR